MPIDSIQAASDLMRNLAAYPGAVRHQEHRLRARHLRVRQERRHHAESAGVYKVAANGGPAFFETVTPVSVAS